MIGHARLPAALVERRRRASSTDHHRPTFIDLKYDTRTKLRALLHAKRHHHHGSRCRKTALSQPQALEFSQGVVVVHHLEREMDRAQRNHSQQLILSYSIATDARWPGVGCHQRS